MHKLCIEVDTKLLDYFAVQQLYRTFRDVRVVNGLKVSEKKELAIKFIWSRMPA